VPDEELIVDHDDLKNDQNKQFIFDGEKAEQNNFPEEVYVK